MENNKINLREKTQGENKNLWIIISMVVVVLLAAAVLVWGVGVFDGDRVEDDFTNIEDFDLDFTDSLGKNNEMVNIDAVQLEIMESFPVQVVAQVKGSMVDECERIGTISQARNGNTIFVTIDEEEIYDCEGLDDEKTFLETINIETIGLPAGTYKVVVNGIEREFELTVDNLIEYEVGTVK